MAVTTARQWRWWQRGDGGGGSSVDVVAAGNVVQ